MIFCASKLSSLSLNKKTVGQWSPTPGPIVSELHRKNAYLTSSKKIQTFNWSVAQKKVVDHCCRP